MSLEYIEVPAGASTELVVIWLHGLGADGHDFEALVPELRLPADVGIRFLFPHAPFRPITLNNGYVMRGWYDISGLDFSAPQDAQGIAESAELVNQLIQQQRAAGIPSEHILLAGFSQGGAVALHTGLRYSEPLAGIMALSCYLPLANRLHQERLDSNQHTPIFMAHGLQDEIVNYQYGATSRIQLEQAGYPVQWHDYTMGHGVSPAEIEDIRHWLLERIDTIRDK